MLNHLSVPGILHTAISIIALLTGFFALIKNGRINPGNVIGKVYIFLTVITCLTGLPIMQTGQSTPWHFLAVIILLLLPVAIYAKSIKVFGTAVEYFQLFIMSLTLFFSCIPAIVEIATRLPMNHPLAAGPNDPIVQLGLVLLFTGFVAGVIYQMLKLRARKKRKTKVIEGDISLG